VSPDGVAQPLGAGPRRAVHVQPVVGELPAPARARVGAWPAESRRTWTTNTRSRARGVGGRVRLVDDEAPTSVSSRSWCLSGNGLRRAAAGRRVRGDGVVPERAGARERRRRARAVAGRDVERVGGRRPPAAPRSRARRRAASRRERVAHGHAQRVAHAGAHERAGHERCAAGLRPREHGPVERRVAGHGGPARRARLERELDDAAGAAAGRRVFPLGSARSASVLGTDAWAPARAVPRRRPPPRRPGPGRRPPPGQQQGRRRPPARAALTAGTRSGPTPRTPPSSSRLHVEEAAAGLGGREPGPRVTAYGFESSRRRPCRSSAAELTVNTVVPGRPMGGGTRCGPGPGASPASLTTMRCAPATTA
jgi:hypothetical protein